MSMHPAGGRCRRSGGAADFGDRLTSLKYIIKLEVGARKNHDPENY